MRRRTIYVKPMRRKYNARIRTDQFRVTCASRLKKVSPRYSTISRGWLTCACVRFKFFLSSLPFLSLLLFWSRSYYILTNTRTMSLFLYAIDTFVYASCTNTCSMCCCTIITTTILQLLLRPKREREGIPPLAPPSPETASISFSLSAPAFRSATDFSFFFHPLFHTRLHYLLVWRTMTKKSANARWRINLA